MSNSQVKISLPYAVKIEKPQAVPSNVHTALNEGRKLNLSRCQQTKPSVDCASFRVKQEKCRERVAKVWKICHPKQLECDCNHGCDFILDRGLMSRSEHLNYLAQPKKVSGNIFEKLTKNFTRKSSLVSENPTALRSLGIKTNTTSLTPHQRAGQAKNCSRSADLQRACRSSFNDPSKKLPQQALQKGLPNTARGHVGGSSQGKSIPAEKGDASKKN